MTYLCDLKGTEHRSIYSLAAIFFEWRIVKELKFYFIFFISQTLKFEYFKQKKYYQHNDAGPLY